MEVFGIIVAMLIVLVVGGYISVITTLAGAWFNDGRYTLGAIAAFIITIALEIFIFTSYFTLGLQ